MKALEQRLAWKRIFDKSAKMPTTPEEAMAWLRELAGDLSPENLACDGEASPAQVRKKLNSLKKEWAALEKIVGRKVSEGELY